MLSEAIDILDLRRGDIAIDCTLGGGGHTARLLERVGTTGRVIAFDRDADAIHHARSIFRDELASHQLMLVHRPFGEIADEVAALGLAGKISGILADIGVSSHQIDVAERGFSFQSDGPLDMRMDRTRGFSAREYLADAEESEIASVLWKYGEEPKSRIIAKLICQHRQSKPLETTGQLADLIKKNIFWKEHSRKHPATRAFQALRILVNDELGELERLIGSAPSLLRSNGVLAIISFHSLEDRITKDALKDLAGKSSHQNLPKDLPMTAEEVNRLVNAKGTIIKPFPQSPDADEIKLNPRARSAKLRAIRLN